MVNKTRKSLIHLRSSVSGKIPTAEQLNYGEIAINYAKDGETLFLKNSENKVVGIQPCYGIIEVTYAELKALRDGKMLKPGQSYRITDFVTTSVQDETRSAGHAFDIIVVADDKETLNEVARAVQHEGDTYFSNSNLEAWELKYCLDNDTKRFAWADTTNGKGVIWWMKDEFNNSCFYDFKNIQYKVYAVSGEGWEQFCTENEHSGMVQMNLPYRLTKNMAEKRGKYTWAKSTTDFIYAYTWSKYISNTKETIDASFGTEVYNNEIGPNKEKFTQDDSLTITRLSLNFFIVLPNDLDEDEVISNNNKAEAMCHDMVTGSKCSNWTCGYSCYDWTCCSQAAEWSCDKHCYGWTCGAISQGWSCGKRCKEWSCGSFCISWSCGDNCANWSCGFKCQSWTCGNTCKSWTCGDQCSYWSCGNRCSGWACGYACQGWASGNVCSGWTCGDNCSYWSCGNYCRFWSCGELCQKWICGNDSSGWKCGNNCFYWTCENGCNDWICGSSKTMLQNFVYNFHLGNDVSYINFSTNGTSSETTPLKNFTIKSGISGTSNNTPLQIVIDTADFPLNSDYEWIIAKNSKGEIRQYCEADLIN